MSGRVPPSSKANVRRVSRTEEERAATRYARFTGHEPENIGRIFVPPLPKVVALVGDLDAISYTTVRDGETEKYIHTFKAECRPLLCVDADGERIIIIDGKFKFTERGFVDKPRNRR